MKVLRSIIILICISLSFSGYSQIYSDDIPDAKIFPPSEYNGESLWGYINGGADLYLEYGFNKLMVQEIEWKDILLKVNIYEMSSEEAGFGIFSANVHKCKKRDVAKAFDCQNPYQYQAFFGRFYISIINENGKQEAQDVSKVLGEILLSKIEDTEFLFPELFYTDTLKDHLEKIKLFKGELGLQNGFPDWADHFSGMKNYSVWLLPVEDINIALIELEDKKSTEFFLTQLKTDKAEQLKSWRITENSLILYEASSNNPDSEKYLKEVEGYIK